MNATRTLLLLTLLSLSLPILIERFRSPRPLTLELRRQLTTIYGTGLQVFEAGTSSFEICLPVENERSAECQMNCLPSTITAIWRLQPSAPVQLEANVQPYGQTAVYSPGHWSGRRYGQLFRWERPTDDGPVIELIGYWMICADNRGEVKSQVLQAIQNSGFGGTDQIGWLGEPPCNSKTLLSARNFHPEALLEQLDRYSGFFELRLYQGPGRGFSTSRTF